MERSAGTRTLTAGVLLIVVTSLLVGCSDDDTGADRPSGSPVTTAREAIAPATTAPATTAPATSAPATSALATSAPATSALATSVPATTAPASTAPATTAAISATTTSPADGSEQIVLGESVQGRPITVVRRGEPGGAVVLVIGVIHGDEAAGAAIVDELLTAAVPDDVELWLVRSMNPDGQAAGIRHNINGVDLNRNFPANWGPIAVPGDWQYAGPAAASEPETQAMLRLAELIAPDLTLWYHQDLFRISPASGREGEVRARYAERTGLPLVEVTGGTYTGTASTWSRSIADDDGVGFTVELGESLTLEEAQRHAVAVLDVATLL
jgi:protein MpaA